MTGNGWLWCVNIFGPDDVHAAPDFDTAERWAVNQNAKMREYTVAAGMSGDPHWPEVRAVVAVWPGTAESHAADLPKSEVEFAKSNAPFALASCDSHRMAETGTGSVRSMTGAAPQSGETPK